MLDSFRFSKEVIQMNNRKVEIRETQKYGNAVFAIDKIYTDEVIGVFDGKFCDGESAMKLPTFEGFSPRHAVQCAPRVWRDGKIDGIARYIAHSCDPNCGIKNYFEVVAMRDIEAGEEITWDYAMTEDSDFRMDCRCGSRLCRGMVGAYSQLPDSVKERYKGYISEWLL